MPIFFAPIPQHPHSLIQIIEFSSRFSVYCFAVILSTPVDSFLRSWRNDFRNKDKSILWAKDVNTNSGFASASILIRTSEDSPTNTGGFVRCPFL